MKYRSTLEDGRLGEPTDFIGPGGFPKEKNTSACIQLVEMEGRVPKIRDEALIYNSRKNEIAFSPNGEYLVIFRRQVNELDIYHIDDANELFTVFE